MKPGRIMLKKNLVVLDTNVIIRFLIGDHEEFYQKAVEIFKRIENHSLRAVLLEAVFAETVFVLEKVYKVERTIIRSHLQKILALNGIVNSQKQILFKALEIYEQSKFDIIDSLLAAYGLINAMNVVSFDKDIRKAQKI